ncbi:hypothetical protein [Streptomyces sp. AM6-12]|uniref:hypothetical protein n=1 Tax=Streptomyces sp. AM6-12 TaxID=3345149 RepID=UPI0037B82671
MLNTIRAEATRSVRGAHMMQLEPLAADEAAFARLQEQSGPELAWVLLIIRNGGERGAAGSAARARVTVAARGGGRAPGVTRPTDTAGPFR